MNAKKLISNTKNKLFIINLVVKSLTFIAKMNAKKYIRSTQIIAKVIVRYIDAKFKSKKKTIWFQALEYPHSSYAIEERLLRCLTGE
jgi:hypothetical protein